MGFVGLFLLMVGGLAVFGGAIWLLILAFQESILWGVGSLVVPFVSLVFAIMFWDKTKTAFLLHLGGIAVMVFGAILSGITAEPMPGVP